MNILDERVTFKDGDEKSLRQVLTDIYKVIFNGKTVTDTIEQDNEYLPVYVKDEATYTREGDTFNYTALTAAGERGPAGTITIGNVTYGIVPEVVNTGTPEEAILDFKLPRGNDGKAGTIAIGNVVTGDVISVVNSGTDTDAIFDFTLVKGPKGDKGEDAIMALVPKGNWIPNYEYHTNDYVTGPDNNTYTCIVDHTSDDDPDTGNVPPNPNYWQLIALRGAQGARGDPSTVTIGTVTDGDECSVTNVGTLNDVVLNFVLKQGEKGDQGDEGPQGIQGDAATITVGTVTESDDEVAVENVGTDTDAIFNFTLRRGEKGDTGEQGIQGIQGDAATITIGTVTEGDDATVINVGDEHEAILNFVIPHGQAVPIGSVVAYMGLEAPNDTWLICDGSEFDADEYPILFALLGDNNKLPDMRETALVGIGQNTTFTMTAHDVYSLGEFKDDQMQAHTHSTPAHSRMAAYNAGGSWTTYENGVKSSGAASGRTGTITRGKRFGVNYIIKAK